MAQEKNQDDKNSRKEKGKETVTDHPCALCKHQRKKCSEEDCTMWRFFPSTEGDIFVSALKKTFGISTIIEKIGKLDGIEKKAQAVFALKKEAILWKDDPVHGPSGLISRLKQEEIILKQHIIRHLQLQGHNLNLDNLHVPVDHNPHVHASSSSAAGSAGTQQSYCMYY
ncbi:hypothetical protein LIER_01301 [Lithospermum erythrorhizon]|uniref:LOB domain-containing protein n=1 Tax=Lithospermum erythrorhizon TaxID=34254 RepID=A0AAV3NKH5_LITER